MSAGCLAVAIGVAAIFIPVLPTTPFIVLGAFCFSNSSETLHRWLLSQPYVPQLIRRWRERGRLPVRTKLALSAVACCMTAFPIITFPIVSLQIITGLIGLTMLATLWIPLQSRNNCITE